MRPRITSVCTAPATTWTGCSSAGGPCGASWQSAIQKQSFRLPTAWPPRPPPNNNRKAEAAAAAHQSVQATVRPIATSVQLASDNCNLFLNLQQLTIPIIVGSQIPCLSIPRPAATQVVSRDVIWLKPQICV